jgi:ferric iron reductase protein FhuF
MTLAVRRPPEGRDRSSVTDTAPVTDRQLEVARRLPGAAGFGLVAPSTVPRLPAALLADPGRIATLLGARGARQGTDDLRVLATVWWYSASSVLLAPPLSGLVTGVPLSARLEDMTLSVLPDGLPVAVTSVGASGTGLAAELRTTLGAVIPAIAEAGGMRQRPLWAVATDSMATVLLTLGRALGDVAAATGLAAPLAAAIGPVLPSPRYEDVGGARFVRRASCCLLYRLPGGPVCTSCPRRPPAERQLLLEDTAGRW